jgi:hypothetical protein
VVGVRHHMEGGGISLQRLQGVLDLPWAVATLARVKSRLALEDAVDVGHIINELMASGEGGGGGGGWCGCGCGCACACACVSCLTRCCLRGG